MRSEIRLRLWVALAIGGVVGGCDTSEAVDAAPMASAGTSAVPAADGGLTPQAPEAGRRPPPSAPATGAPADLTRTELGGYKLARELAAGDSSPAAESRSDPTHCNVMTAIVRDFRGASEPGGHPDFEVFDGKRPTSGLVATSLGPDRKPVYASDCEVDFDKAHCPQGQMTTNAARFAQWYHSVDQINRSYALELAFVASDGAYTFESKNFFPLDDAGYGNSGGKRKHNFSFTTELHGSFRYRGGEVFRFTGDDDLWLFIDGRLAIDLGGLHPPASAELELDALAQQLGLALGDEYALDLFHAERHSANSNFRVDTSLEFSDCGRVDPELL